MNFLSGYKTYILAGLGVMKVLIGFLTGDMTFVQFLGSPEVNELILFTGLGTLRAGVGK
jgi:hypothetical protein